MRQSQIPTTPTSFPAVRQTRLPGGYMGKILRVDMTTGKLTDLNLPEEPLLRKYWGGQLFAEYVLLNELPLDIDPYDPSNVIVGMTGPITGTGFTPGGTKMCFVYLESGDASTPSAAAPPAATSALRLKPPATTASSHRRGADSRNIFTSAKTKSSCATPACLGQRRCATPKKRCARIRATKTRASAPSARQARTSFARRCWSTITITRRRTAWAR